MHINNTFVTVADNNNNNTNLFDIVTMVSAHKTNEQTKIC